MGKNISRTSKLTARQAAKYDEIRRQVEAEIPPAKTNMVRQCIQRLRTLREEQGLSLAEMEKRTGMTRANLCRLENEGRSVQLRTLERYARALGCQVEVNFVPVPKRKKRRPA